MPKYIFAYHGGSMPETEEEGIAEMARWQAWLGGLGDAVIDPGAPVGLSKTVSASGVSDDGGPDPLSGYSIIKASDMNDAIARIDGCPHIGQGTIEVAEIIEM